jgi:hypothetical protein
MYIREMSHLSPFTLLGPNPSGFRRLFTITLLGSRVVGDGGVGDEAPPIEETHLGPVRAHPVYDVGTGGHEGARDRISLSFSADNAEWWKTPEGVKAASGTAIAATVNADPRDHFLNLRAELER